MSLADLALEPGLVPCGASSPGRRSAGSAASFGPPPELAVVTPTYNERDNIRELIDRLAAALTDVRWEAIVVDDDSSDGTATVARAIGSADGRIRVIRRVGRRGLSSACIEGMMSSGAEVLAVMDADLQHDPAIMKTMLADMRREGADLVVASRYLAGGGLGDWSRARSRLSRLATRVTQGLSGLKVSDPMSGCFLIRREALEGRVSGLSGRGFKILLDILLTAGPPLRIVETPLVFASRRHGESKLTGRVIADGAALLVVKALARHLPARVLAFGAVGASGVVVHLVALSVLRSWTDLAFGAAQAAAIGLAMLSNFMLNDRGTFSHFRRGRTAVRMARFVAVCLLGAAVNMVVAQNVFTSLGDWRMAALMGVAAGAVCNFVLSTLLVWPGRAPSR